MAKQPWNGFKNAPGYAAWMARKKPLTANRRARWIAAGLCCKCGGKRDSACKTCGACLAQGKREKDARIAAARAGGRCTKCTKRAASDGYATCAECRANIDNAARAEYARARRKILTAEVLAAYGGKCVCCGETEPLFLEIDHIRQDGADHRREITQGATYAWLKRNGFPKDNFRCLCGNCNFARVRNKGECPHETRRREEAAQRLEAAIARGAADGEVETLAAALDALPMATAVAA